MTFGPSEQGSHSKIMYKQGALKIEPPYMLTRPLTNSLHAIKKYGKKLTSNLH